MPIAQRSVHHIAGRGERSSPVPPHCVLCVSLTTHSSPSEDRSASLRRAAETRPIDLAIEVLGTWHLVGGSEEAGPAMLRCMDAEHDYQRARVVLASGDAPARAIAWRRELLTRASYDPARQVRDTAGMVLRWLIGAGQGEPWIASAIAAAKQST